jgi:hypothetical protein
VRRDPHQVSNRPRRSDERLLAAADAADREDWLAVQRICDAAASAASADYAAASADYAAASADYAAASADDAAASAASADDAAYAAASAASADDAAYAAARAYFAAYAARADAAAYAARAAAYASAADYAAAAASAARAARAAARATDAAREQCARRARELLMPDAPDARALRLAVAAHIEAHPELHDQAKWGDGSDDPSCGTPCCVAGWACHLGGGAHGLSVEFAGSALLAMDGAPMPSFDAGATRKDILRDLRAGGGA